MASSSNAKAEQLEPLLRLRKDSLIEDDGTGPCVKVYPPDGWVFFNKEGEVEKSALVPFYKQDTTFKKSTDQSEQEPSAAAATAINAATDTSTPAPKEVYQDKWKSFREWAKPKLKTSDAELSVKLDDLKKNCKLETKQGPLLLLQKAEKRLGRQEWKVEPDTLEALPKEPKKVIIGAQFRPSGYLPPDCCDECLAKGIEFQLGAAPNKDQAIASYQCRESGCACAQMGPADWPNSYCAQLGWTITATLDEMLARMDDDCLNAADKKLQTRIKVHRAFKNGLHAGKKDLILELIKEAKDADDLFEEQKGCAYEQLSAWLGTPSSRTPRKWSDPTPRNGVTRFELDMRIHLFKQAQSKAPDHVNCRHPKTLLVLALERGLPEEFVLHLVEKAGCNPAVHPKGANAPVALLVEGMNRAAGSQYDAVRLLKAFYENGRCPSVSCCTKSDKSLAYALFHESCSCPGLEFLLLVAEKLHSEIIREKLEDDDGDAQQLLQGILRIAWLSKDIDAIKTVFNMRKPSLERKPAGVAGDASEGTSEGTSAADAGEHGRKHSRALKSSEMWMTLVGPADKGFAVQPAPGYRGFDPLSITTEDEDGKDCAESNAVKLLCLETMHSHLSAVRQEAKGARLNQLKGEIAKLRPAGTGQRTKRKAPAESSRAPKRSKPHKQEWKDALYYYKAWMRLKVTDPSHYLVPSHRSLLQAKCRTIKGSDDHDTLEAFKAELQKQVEAEAEEECEEEADEEEEGEDEANCSWADGALLAEDPPRPDLPMPVELW